MFNTFIGKRLLQHEANLTCTHRPKSLLEPSLAVVSEFCEGFALVAGTEQSTAARPDKNLPFPWPESLKQVDKDQRSTGQGQGQSQEAKQSSEGSSSSSSSKRKKREKKKKEKTEKKEKAKSKKGKKAPH